MINVLVHLILSLANFGLMLFQILTMMKVNIRHALGVHWKDADDIDRKSFWTEVENIAKNTPWHTMTGFNYHSDLPPSDKVLRGMVRPTTVTLVRMDVLLEQSATALRALASHTSPQPESELSARRFNGVIIDPPWSMTPDDPTFWTNDLLQGFLTALEDSTLVDGNHAVAVWLPTSPSVDFMEPFTTCGYENIRILDFYFREPPTSQTSYRVPDEPAVRVAVAGKGWNTQGFNDDGEDAFDHCCVRFFTKPIRAAGFPGPRGRTEIYNLAFNDMGKPVTLDQKPVDAVRWIIRHFFPSPPSILSVCSGSGTDAIAACEEGATEVMCIEKCPKTFEGMRVRLEKYQEGQKAKFGTESGSDADPHAYVQSVQCDMGLSAKPSAGSVAAVMAELSSSFDLLNSKKTELMAAKAQWLVIVQKIVETMSPNMVKGFCSDDHHVLEWVMKRKTPDLALKAYRAARQWPTLPNDLKFESLGADWENSWQMCRPTPEHAEQVE